MELVVDVSSFLAPRTPHFRGARVQGLEVWGFRDPHFRGPGVSLYTHTLHYLQWWFGWGRHAQGSQPTSPAHLQTHNLCIKPVSYLHNKKNTRSVIYFTPPSRCEGTGIVNEENPAILHINWWGSNAACMWKYWWVVLTEIKCDASLSALRILVKRGCGRHRAESLGCIYMYMFGSKNTYIFCIAPKEVFPLSMWPRMPTLKLRHFLSLLAMLLERWIQASWDLQHATPTYLAWRHV